MMQMIGIVDRSKTLLAALFGKQKTPTDKSLVEGPIQHDARRKVPQVANGQHVPRRNPGYRLMFCLRSKDNGRPDNPALLPMVDDRDQPLTFASVGAAMQYQARLGRISADLVYYAVESDQAK